MEVGPQTRKQLLQTKLKIGWDICNVADYLVPTICYKCSRYNHKHNDCKGEKRAHTVPVNIRWKNAQLLQVNRNA